MEATQHTIAEGPEQLVGRVQDLQERLDAAGDSPLRELADELVSAVVQMYGAGLERIVRALMSAGPAGEETARALAEDPMVATLLLIHDLHPVPLEQRVQAALESVRPYMESHGGNVELLSLQDGVARLRLRGSCSDCSASSVTLELAIKQALEEAAPDLEGLEVEGVAEQDQMTNMLPMASAPQPSGFELPMVISGAPPAPAWYELEALDLTPGHVTGVEIAGARLAVANVDGTLLAYGDKCAGCGAPVHGGTLQEGALTCAGCGRSFFLPGAGRSMDDDRLQLEPVPLLRERGSVKVALAR
jgi:Fe-S cluster biogenesis protein NfuA/nitrite reductase/ring-hydroxylating ferredoxin subunit